ncbi:hairy/enhancer-of-split related with YRPW motif protein 1-like [Montipora capricornis]|uniref:hairy/enhancer-of-split related with YRPW motif protein 1-like n=1 Tax=Montipora capricornis TaxID=246305 RepID=UPI0035F1EEAE
MKRTLKECNSDEGEFWDRSNRDSDDVEVENPEVRARKQRRGQIEKRRRDRINSSLAELRQLVPEVAKRQGSTKLEKAEVLQLTVEHLKSLKYRAKYSRGFTIPSACNDCISAHQECMNDANPCLSEALNGTETKLFKPVSPGRRQIANNLNWSTSLPSGGHRINPSASMGFWPARKKFKLSQDQLLTSQIFPPLSPMTADSEKKRKQLVHVRCTTGYCP